MPNSLKSKLSSLRYKRLLTDEEYKELIKKLDGHDREIRAKDIDEFAEKFIYKAVCEGCSGCCNCYEEGRQSECEDWKAYMEIAEQLKGGAE